MSEFALYVAAGAVGATHAATSPEFTDFVGGQPLWLSFKYKATRASGSSWAWIRASLLWYDSVGNNFQTTSVEDVIIDASVDWSFKELRHVAPIGAVKGVCKVEVTPAASPMQHDVWVKQLRLGKTQLFSTAGATWNQDVANVPANLAELVGDEEINNKAILDSIAADSVLSVSEKLSTLKKLYMDLEGRYNDLVNRAAALGISTITLDATRANWQNLLASFSPAWNDTKNDTAILQSLLGTNEDLNTWTLDAGASRADNGVYKTLTDNSSTGQALVFTSQVLGPSGAVQFTGALRVKKDSVPLTTGCMAIAVRNAGGGTFSIGRIALRTDTGQVTTAFASSDSIGIWDLGDEWAIFVTKTLPADSGGAQMQIIPAYGTDMNGGTTDAMRSVDVRNPVFVQGDWTKLGRFALEGTFSAYSRALTTVAKTISEKDATLSTWTGTSARPGNLVDLTGSEGIKNNLLSIAANGAFLGGAGGQVTIGGLTPNGLDDVAEGVTAKHFTDPEKIKLTGVEAGATLGAIWGANLANRPGNLSVLAGTEDIKNNLLSIGQNGALSNGNGQVTIGGLGGGPWATDQRPVNSVFRGAPNLVFNGSLRLLNSSNWALGWEPNAAWGLGSDGASGNYFISTSSGTNTFQSDPIAVRESTYALQAEMFGGGLTAGTLELDVQWYSDTAGTAKILDGDGIRITGGGWQRIVSAGLVAPAGVLSARIRVFTQGATISSGGAVAARRIKLHDAGPSGIDVPFSDEATNSVENLTRPGTGRRLADGRNQTSNQNYGIRSLFSPPTVTSLDAGTTATISIGASSYNTDWGTVINLPSTTVPGCAFSTKYYYWRNQADPATVGESYSISTDLADALGTGKAYMGFHTTVADGTVGSGGTGGNVGGDDCVSVTAWVELEDGTFKRARDVVVGDRILVLDYDSLTGTKVVTVESNEVGKNEMVTLTTASGITLTLSLNTPIVMRDRTWDIAANAWKYELPVKDEDGFRWERCTGVQYEMFGEVAHIRCDDCCYAAGNERGRSIFTHNPYSGVKP